MEYQGNDDKSKILAHNAKDWRKLIMLLQDPEGTGVYWLYYDNPLIIELLPDAIKEKLPQLKHHNIYIDEDTISLKQILLDQGANKIPEGSLINIFGIEKAAKSEVFRARLNMNRDSIFRKSPGNVIFWGDFESSKILSSRTYDFWSWMSITFEFNTPSDLLTETENRFGLITSLENSQNTPDKVIHVQNTPEIHRRPKPQTISDLDKKTLERISQLEHEYYNTLIAMGYKPTDENQMRDLVLQACAISLEYYSIDAYPNGINVMEELLILCPEMLSEKDKIDLYTNLCYAYQQFGNLPLALELGQKVLQIAADNFGISHFEYAQAQENLGSIYDSLDENNIAKELFESALKITVNTLGADHPQVAKAQTNLVYTLIKLNELDHALELAECSLELYIKNYGASHPYVLTNKTVLAHIFSLKKEYSKAISQTISVLNQEIEDFGALSVEVIKRKVILAKLHYDAGDFRQSKEVLESCLDKSIIDSEEYQFELNVVYRNLAHVCSDLELFGTAKDYCNKAFQLDLKLFGTDHPNTRDTLLLLRMLETIKLTPPKIHFNNTPQNSPCPCGSGKKYKRCHGAK